MSLAHYVPTNGNTMPAWVRVSDLSLAREGPDQRANVSLWRLAILYPFVVAALGADRNSLVYDQRSPPE